MAKDLTPHFDDVQAHYDLSDDFFTEIFPGGRLPSIEIVQERSSKAGFELTRRQSLQPHYARTLDLWAQALEAHHDEAVAIQSEEFYERYMKYLTGCADAFRIGYIDVNQFTLEKSQGNASANAGDPARPV